MGELRGKAVLGWAVCVWERGFSERIQNTKDMNESIQKALEALSQADIAGYFDEMDKITPAHKLAELNNLRSMFTSDRYDQSYHQKLDIMAKSVQRYLDNPDEPIAIAEETKAQGGLSVSNTNVSIKGDQINAQNSTIHTESESSKRIKLFLYVFVPLLAISLAVIGYRYQEMQKPLNLTVQLKNLTENPNLPFEKGQITLSYGDKTESQEITGKEIIFKGIPANFKGESIKLDFRSEGFRQIDTVLSLSAEAVTLPIRRDEAYSKVFGIVKDDNNQPVAGAEVSIQDLSSTTQSNGRFVIQIPFDKQLKKQRVQVFKKGFQTWDYESPVNGEEIQIILEK